MRQHEARSLDSMSKQFFWVDSFIGDQLQDEWRVTLTSGGTGAVVDGVAGGIYRLGTPTASDSATLDWTTTRTLIITKDVALETRVACGNGVTDTLRVLASLSYDATNRIKMHHAVDSTQVNIYSMVGAGSDDLDSGADVDANYHIYRIQTSSLVANHVHFYFNGVETTNSPLATVANIPTSYLMPFFYIESNADTAPATTMSIDYIACRQNR